jgi:hypothetical protein
VKSGVELRDLLRLVVLLGLGLLLCRTTTDPDLWGHVRFGQDMIAARTIALPDAYSFTSDRAWINHEWLAEILMALSFDTLGPLGLNLLRIGIVVAVLALVWRRLSSGAMEGAALVFLALTAIGIYLRVYPVRPQMFSVLLFGVLLDTLTRFDAGERRRALLVVPALTATWANLHGGWIVGVGTLIAWGAGRIAFPTTRERHVRSIAIIVAAATAATLVNPYGFELWRFMRQTVGLGRPMINDWQPMYALPPAFWLTVALPLGAAACIAVRRWRAIDPVYLMIAAVLAVAAVRVSRLDAFFALLVAFCLAPAWASADVGRPEPEARPSGGLRRPLSLRLARAVCALVFVVAGGRWLPVIAATSSFGPEPEAAEHLRANRVVGRMLTWFDWGQYAIWHFGPAIQVSMDGRRETAYSDRVIAEHMRFYSGGPGAAAYPDSIRADYVWIPKALPVVTTLRQAGWQTTFEGPVSVILTRRPPAITSQVVSLRLQTRGFPGP